MNFPRQFMCRTCGQRHEPCVDMNDELQRIRYQLHCSLGPAGDGKTAVELVKLHIERFRNLYAKANPGLIHST